MAPELWQVQLQLNLEYLESNAAARGEKWLALESDEARAKMDPTRFLREEFVNVADRDSLDKVIVLKTHARLEIHEAAEPLGLQHESTDAPLNADGIRQSPNRWIVVGKSRMAVLSKISEIHRDAQRTQKRAKEAQDEETRELNRGVISQLTASERSGRWNVVGSWLIQIPYASQNWGEPNQKCTLDIYLSKDGTGRQMFAVFDFIVVTGIMRFLPRSAQGSAQTSGRTRRGVSEEENEEEDDEEDEEGDDEEDEEGDDEAEEEDDGGNDFYLDNKITPSSSHPMWKYRCRGEETGEGEIQLGADEEICSMTFKGLGGTKLEGKFKNGICCKMCHFTVLKISPTPSSHMPDPGDEWSSRSERAYEYARVARWH